MYFTFLFFRYNIIYIKKEYHMNCITVSKNYSRTIKVNVIEKDTIDFEYSNDIISECLKKYKNNRKIKKK